MSAVAHIKQYKTGRFYSDEFRGERSWNGYEHNVLLRNEGADERGLLQFVDVALALGADDIRDGRGLALADFDNDGDLDMVVNNNPSDTGHGQRMGPLLLKNNLGASRSWLAVELQGTRSNRDGVGAVVAVTADGVLQTRHVMSGSSYASQHSTRLYFGLDEASEVEVLSVQWPGGGRQRFEDIGVRQLVQITEGEGFEASPLAGKHTAMGF